MTMTSAHIDRAAELIAAQTGETKSAVAASLAALPDQRLRAVKRLLAAIKKIDRVERRRARLGVTFQ